MIISEKLKVAINNYYLNNGKATFYQAIRYIIVGIFNTILGLGVIFILFNLFHLNYILSNIIGYIFGLINSFIWNKKFTFRSKKPIKQEIPRFIIIFIFCYLINLLSIVIMVENFFINENIAFVIGMIIYTVTNFLGNKLITFNPSKA